MVEVRIQCTPTDNTQNSNLLPLEIKEDGSSGRYSEIWDELLSHAIEDNEKKLLEEFKTIDCNSKEKPTVNVTVTLGKDIYGTANDYYCQLLWKKSKVAYFSADNSDEYDQIKDKTSWTCFCGNDTNLSANTILQSLSKEE